MSTSNEVESRVSPLRLLPVADLIFVAFGAFIFNAVLSGKYGLGFGSDLVMAGANFFYSFYFFIIGAIACIFVLIDSISFRISNTGVMTFVDGLIFVLAIIRNIVFVVSCSDNADFSGFLVFFGFFPYLFLHVGLIIFRERVIKRSKPQPLPG